VDNEHRKCAECGDKLVGRADQKFCSDNCRNAFNNRQNSDANNLVRNINNTLRRNRRILHDLNPSEKAKTNRDKLLQKGFNFNYFTHQYLTKTGSTYFFCYELGYLMLDNDEVLIVRRDSAN
jgi:predicted nucleic acid-binding Zn ribbon protein